MTIWNDIISLEVDLDKRLTCPGSCCPGQRKTVLHKQFCGRPEKNLMDLFMLGFNPDQVWCQQNAPI